MIAKPTIHLLKHLFLLAILVAYTTNVNAQINLVKDINTNTIFGSSTPRQITAFSGNQFFFTAQDLIHGRELWISDGTDTGTRLVKDIYGGFTGSDPSDLTVVGDKLFFTAKDGIHGRELWISDGTEAGTQLVKDIQKGITSNFEFEFDNKGILHYFTAFDNKLFFSFDDEVNGNELWVSDGTEAGTKIFKELIPGKVGASVSRITLFNNKIYFVASNNSNGSELWMSDGTEAGTQLVRDIHPGQADSFIYALTVVGNKLFFSADDGTNGQELWVSDGTEAGTQLAKNIIAGAAGTSFSHTIAFDNKLFFVTDDKINGAELWVSDGSEVGTKIVKDIYPGLSNAFPRNLVVAGNQLFFSANDGVNGSELWKTDGTEAGTVLVKDLSQGNSGFPSISESITVGNKLLFRFLNNVWISDGTDAGTKEIKAFNSQNFEGIPGFFAIVGANIYFSAGDGLGGELWVTDGTEVGTKLVKDIVVGKQGVSSTTESENIVKVGNKLFFPSGRFSSPSRNLTISDGTAAGTIVSPTVSIGRGNRVSTEFKGKFYFVGIGSAAGSELWESDGTETGTKIVKDINNSSSSFIFWLAASDNLLFFNADDGIHGNELWVSDGTEAGTKLVKDISPGAASTVISSVHALKDKAIFGIRTSTGTGVWVSDGTEAGTQSLGIINPKTSVEFFKVINNQLYFVADANPSGYELWVTDGTVAGSKMIKDIFPGNSSSDPSNFYPYNGKVYFSAQSSTNNFELWVTDGTDAGTTLVKEINTVSGSSFPSNFFEYNGKLYFKANDGVNGDELWVTDGTEAGTKLVTDINQGAAGSSPSGFNVLDGKLYFFAYDKSNGYELRETDGTTTTLVQDLNHGVASSFIFNSNTKSDGQIVQLNNRLYFYAYTNTFGEELFTLAPDAVKIIDFSPKSGKAGDEVTITGSNFGLLVPNNLVKFNGRTANVLSASFNELKVTVPDSVTTGKITVEANGLTSISATNFTVEGPLGIAENLLNKALKVYPNPVVDQKLKIELTEQKGKSILVKLFDLQGRAMKVKYESGEIDLSHIAAGQYLLKISVGNATVSRKILKK